MPRAKSNTKVDTVSRTYPPYTMENRQGKPHQCCGNLTRTNHNYTVVKQERKKLHEQTRHEQTMASSFHSQMSTGKPFKKGEKPLRVHHKQMMNIQFMGLPLVIQVVTALENQYQGLSKQMIKCHSVRHSS